MIPHELSLKRCAEADIDAEKYAQSHQMLCSVVGEEWLAAQEAARERNANFSARHPLYRELSSPTEQSAALVCELADYLLAFKGDPKLKEVIENLRSTAYSSTLLELAMAYRLKEAGCAAVRLRPPVPGGEADVGADLGGTELILEASAIPSDPFAEDERFRLIEVCQAACRRALAGSGPAAVGIVVRRRPEGNVQEKLRRAVASACKVFSADKATCVADDDFCSITVRAVDPLREPNPLRMTREELSEYCGRQGWHAVVSDGTSPAGVWEPSEEEISETARLYFRFPAKDADPVQLVLEKLRNERRQLRGAEGIQAVVLEVTPFGTVLFEAIRQQLTNEVAREISRRPDPTGVWLLQRGFSGANRFGYRGAYVANPAAPRRIPDSLIQSLQAVERRLARLAE